MNVQVACTLTGRLAWVSDAVDGSRHDTYCLGESGVLLTFDPGNWVGDKGYVGNDMITSIRKPASRDLLEWEKEFNLSEDRQDRALFGDERIAEVLRASGGLTAQKTADALVAAVLAFQDGQPRDDIAVVVVKAPPPSRH